MVELAPLQSNRVVVDRRPDGSKRIKLFTDDGSYKELDPSEVWHWKGLSWDSSVGLNIIRYAREAIGLAMATEQSHATRHANGIESNGVYSVEGSLNKDQYGQLREWLAKYKPGGENYGSPMILDRDAKFHSTEMNGVDAQHLETRNHQIQEICRMFRVMPIMAGYADKTATYASAEQMFLAHVVHTLAPWYERIEQSADAQLLTQEDRRAGYYTKFTTAGLLRGAVKDQGEYLSKLVERGIITRNEARSLIEFNRLEGLDEPLTPANLLGETNDAE